MKPVKQRAVTGLAASLLLLVVAFYSLSCDAKSSPYDKPNSARAGDPSAPIERDSVSDDRPRPTSFADLAAEIGADDYPFLKAVHEVTDFSTIEFNPKTAIAAVNVLHPLGKDRALALLERYVSLATDNPRRTVSCDLNPERVAIVGRLLFENPSGASMPQMYDWRLPEDAAKRSPLYPLILVDDIPFAVYWWRFRTGVMPDHRDSLNHFRNHCRLRQAPLHPRIRPTEAARRFLAAEQWKAWPDLVHEGETIWHRFIHSALRRQALLASRPAYDGPAHPDRVVAVNEDEASQEDTFWSEALAGCAKLGLKWDAQRQEFVAAAP